MKKLFTILGIAFALSANAQVTINPSAAAICQGQTETLTVQVQGFGVDTLVYQWLQNSQLFGAPSNDTLAVTPAVGVWNYAVNVSTPGGQNIGTGFVTVTVNANPTATANNTGPYCVNDTISLTASGGVDYVWTGPDGWTATGPNPTRPANLTAAGTYTVAATDGNGCSASASTQVVVTSPPTANVDSIPMSCNGLADGSAFVSFVSGGTPPFTYLWSNGATGSSTTGLSVGNYSVTITDANGCTVSAGTVVTQPAAITLSAQVTSVTCNGGGNGSIDLTVSGGTSPFTYVWSNGFTGQDPSGLVAGTHSVTITDANGCTATSSWIISEPAALTLTTSTTTATCLADGSASVSVSGGTAPYSYSWTGGGMNNSITAPAGAYTVTVTDANGCQSLTLATIGTPVPVTASGSVSPISCYAGVDGAIDLTVTGSAPFTYVWSNGSTTQDLTNLGWGNYTVTVTAANGCTTTQSFTLTQPAPLTASASATNVSCFSGNNGSAVVLAQGGTGAYSFSWSPSGGTGSTATNLAAGAYTVTVTDANGCTAQASTVVTQPSQMVASIQSQTNAGCFGNSNGTITVTAAGGTQPYSPLVQWSDGFVGGPIRTGLAPGNYTATITDTNGCSASVTTTINGPTSPIVVQWYAVQNPCSGTNNGGITVNASGGVGPYTFTWGDGFVGPIRTGLTPGNYTVTITDAVGCQAGPFGQTLTANQGLIITTPSVVNYCVGSGETISLTATGGTQPYGYQWTSPNGTFFGTSQDIEPMVNGQYLGGIWTGVVTDGLGCSQTTYITVNLITCTTTSINEQSNNGFNVVAYPNPSTSGQDVTIQMPSNIQEVEIRMMDFVGKTVFQGRTNEPDYRISTSGLAAGTYMVQVAAVDGSASVTKKIIVQ